MDEAGGTWMVASTPKWCSVRLSEVRERGFRLEAAVYDVDSRAAREKIVKSPFGWRPLVGVNGFADAYVCGRFRRIWVERGGIPIFQPSSVPELDPEPDGFLSPKTPVDLDMLRVHPGQILLTCSGTVGKAGLVSKTLDGQVFSHDLLRIACYIPSDTGFVYTFLKSRAGQRLLCGNQYGAVITHVEPDHLATLPVPNAPLEIKARIHEAITQSYTLRDESNELLHKATRLLQGALGIPSLQDFTECSSPDSEQPQAFTVRLRSLSGRLDGSFHVPIVRAIEARLAASGADIATVGDSRISKGVILPGRFKRVYVEEGYGCPMIGGKQLGELNPSGIKFLSIARHKKELASLTVKPNTILVTRSGTIGKIALTPHHWSGWIPSDHILRIIPASSEIAGFLYVWLSSEWAKPLILHYSYGAVIDEIDDIQLASVPVPILPDSTLQTEINNLALRASSLRTQAYDLECAAIQDLERNVLGEP